MEISKEQLTLAHQRILWGDRLLDLDNHLGHLVHLLDGRQYGGAHLLISRVGKPAALASRMLYIHLVPMLYQFGHAIGGHTHPVLIVLNFLWDSDFHNGNDF